MKIVSVYLGLLFLIILGSCQMPELQVAPKDHTAKAKSVEGYGMGAIPDSLLPDGSRSAANPTDDYFTPPEVVLPASFIPTEDIVVGNQGTQGSCTAWATAYAYKTLQERAEMHWDITAARNQFSPSWIYNQINLGKLWHLGGDRGSKVEDALNLIVTKGCDTLANFPYNQSDYSTTPNSSSFQRAAQFKALNWKTVKPTPQDVKRTLVSGNPVIMTFAVHKDLFELTPSNPIYNSTAEPEWTSLWDGGPTFKTHHTVCIVGYDDAKQAFKFINSWGSSWGINGYGWISYEYFYGAWDDLTYGLLNPMDVKTYVLFDKANNMINDISIPTISGDAGVVSSSYYGWGDKTASLVSRSTGSGELKFNLTAGVTYHVTGQYRKVDVSAGSTSYSMTIKTPAGNFDADYGWKQLDILFTSTGSDFSLYGAGYHSGKIELTNLVFSTSTALPIVTPDSGVLSYSFSGSAKTANMVSRSTGSGQLKFNLTAGVMYHVTGQYRKVDVSAGSTGYSMTIKTPAGNFDADYGWKPIDVFFTSSGGDFYLYGAGYHSGKIELVNLIFSVGFVTPSVTPDSLVSSYEYNGTARTANMVTRGGQLTFNLIAGKTYRVTGQYRKVDVTSGYAAYTMSVKTPVGSFSATYDWTDLDVIFTSSGNDFFLLCNGIQTGKIELKNLIFQVQ